MIKKFITGRIAAKIESKKTKTPFYLVPVLWGGWKTLKIFSEFFKTNKILIENVAEPVSYLTFFDPGNELFYIHRFGNISNLFN